MLQYIFKRLLLMVPTFVFITIIVFIIINLAPGRPPQAGGGGSESADQSANSREGFRLFKEQYYLDRPIVLNTRFLLDEGDVADELELIAMNMAGAIEGEAQAHAVGATAARTLVAIHNAPIVAAQAELATPDLTDEQRQEIRNRVAAMPFAELDSIRPARPPQADVFQAEERVENWGQVIVPELVTLAGHYLALTSADGETQSRTWRTDVTASTDASGQTRVTVDGVEWRVNRVLTEKVRFLAVQRLSVNARRPVIVRAGEQGTDEERTLNAQIVAENNQLTRRVYELNASPDERAAVLLAWQAWFTENEPRFAGSLAKNTWMFFMETRFAKYFSNLLRLDLGTSLRYNRPVVEVIGDHWGYSIYLSLASLLLSYFISVPIGVLAAVKQNQFADRGVGIFLFVLYSLPSFFAATLMQTYLTSASDFAPWFPVSGFMGVDPDDSTTLEIFGDIIWHMVLPVICLTYGSLAVLSRYARTGLLDVIRSDYIRTARAKGLSEFVVIMKHAVRNGMIPILTLLGTTLPVLIGGSIIIEFIFNIEGMGKLMLTAINYRDFNIIMGVLLISSILTLLGILLSDISYALVDPRISFD